MNFGRFFRQKIVTINGKSKFLVWHHKKNNKRNSLLRASYAQYSAIYKNKPKRRLLYLLLCKNLAKGLSLKCLMCNCSISYYSLFLGQTYGFTLCCIPKSDMYCDFESTVWKIGIVAHKLWAPQNTDWIWRQLYF